MRQPCRSFSPHASSPVRKPCSVGCASSSPAERSCGRLARVSESAATGTSRSRRIPCRRRLRRRLPRLFGQETEPIAFPSSVPLYFVSRLAAEEVKVVLTGEGADELFLGYPRYRVTAWNERLGGVYRRFLPQGLRQVVSPLVRALP